MSCDSESHLVHDIIYTVHTKRDAPDNTPRSMRVRYRVGLDRWISEWICFEHKGYPRKKAEQWWRSRSLDPVPDTAEQAVKLAEAGVLARTEAIVVRSGEKYDRIIDYRLGPIPGAVSDDEFDNDEVPF